MAIYSCGDISTPYQSNEYHKAMNARLARKCSEIIASSQLREMHHTKKGDFTHLAPVGHLRTVIRG